MRLKEGYRLNREYLETVTASDIDSESATDGQRIIADGSGGADWEDLVVTDSDIDSESATDGQVLTADGAGGASWQDKDGYIVANDIYDNNGSAAVTPVSDIQTPFDGNALTWDEVTGAPGINLSVNFTNVTVVRGVVLRAYYEGSSSHQVNVSLHNYETVAEDIIIRLDDSSNPDYNYRTILIPDGSDYISGGAAQINFIHPITGNNTHDLFIDYVALLT